VALIRAKIPFIHITVLVLVNTPAVPAIVNKVTLITITIRSPQDAFSVPVLDESMVHQTTTTRVRRRSSRNNRTRKHLLAGYVPVPFLPLAFVKCTIVVNHGTNSLGFIEFVDGSSVRSTFIDFVHQRLVGNFTQQSSGVGRGQCRV